MLLFSTILNLSDKINKDAFIDIVLKWNQSAKYRENIVQGVSWNGEKNIKFGTDKLSIEIIDYQEKDIMAVRHEKITSGEVVWDTDFVVNFAERKISIRLDRTFSEDALEMNAAFSTPHFISLLIEHTQYKGKARMEMKVGLTYACMNLKKLAKILAKKE